MEVSELFPRKENSSPAKHFKLVEELVRKHGCYRLFGDAMLLTESDVAALLRNISARGTEDPEPQVGDEGHVVFLGSRVDITDDVFVTWSSPGGVQKAVTEATAVVPDLELLDFAAMTYGDYLAWTESVSSERRMGKWFHRTKRFNHAMTLLFPEGANDDE